MKKALLLCLGLILNNHTYAREVCPFLPLEKAGQGLWAQQYVGADLLRERLKGLESLQFRTEQLVAIWDAHLFWHGQKVSQIIAGPFTSAVIPLERPLDYYWIVEIFGPQRSFYRECLEEQNCPSYINHSMQWLTENAPNLVSEINEKYGITTITSADNHGAQINAIKEDFAREGKLIVVANLGPDGKLFEETNYSGHITIAAPAGLSIQSYDFSGRPEKFGGTSGAAPLVTGSLTGFTLITDYILKTSEAIRLLHKTAIPFPHLPSYHGWGAPGILNAYRIGAVADRLNQKCRGEGGNRHRCISNLLQSDGTYQFERESEFFFEQALDALKAESSCARREFTTKMRMAALLAPESSKAWEYLASSGENGEFYHAMAAKVRRDNDEIVLNQMCRSNNSDDWEQLRYFPAPWLATLLERGDCHPRARAMALKGLLYNTDRIESHLPGLIRDIFSDPQMMTTSDLESLYPFLIGRSDIIPNFPEVLESLVRLEQINAEMLSDTVGFVFYGVGQMPNYQRFLAIVLEHPSTNCEVLQTITGDVAENSERIPDLETILSKSVLTSEEKHCQTFQKQDEAVAPIDILGLIDKSRFMQDEQERLAPKIEDFLKSLKK